MGRHHLSDEGPRKYTKLEDGSVQPFLPDPVSWNTDLLSSDPGSQTFRPRLELTPLTSLVFRHLDSD